MGWFYLTLIYLIFMVTAALVNKKTLKVNGIDELVFGSSVQLVTGILCLILAFITGWSFTFNYKSILLIFAMVATYTVAVSCFYIGLKKIDLSEETIISATGAVWSLILGVIVLNESTELSKFAGVMIILLANGVLFWGESILRFGKYEKIIILSAVFYALGAIWDKQLSMYGNALSYVAVSFGLTGIFMLLLYSNRTYSAFKGTFRLIGYWKGVLANGFLYSMAFWALFTAYQSGGEVSRIFPITLATAVLVPLFGIIFLKEHKGMYRKTIATAILVIGILLIGS